MLAHRNAVLPVPHELLHCKLAGSAGSAPHPQHEVYGSPLRPPGYACLRLCTCQCSCLALGGGGWRPLV
eukprot:1140771-Pelagomonas_calceolata.AAC.17